MRMVSVKNNRAFCHLNISKNSFKLQNRTVDYTYTILFKSIDANCMFEEKNRHASGKHLYFRNSIHRDLTISTKVFLIIIIFLDLYNVSNSIFSLFNLASLSLPDLTRNYNCIIYSGK